MLWMGEWYWLLWRSDGADTHIEAQSICACDILCPRMGKFYGAVCAVKNFNSVRVLYEPWCFHIFIWYMTMCLVPLSKSPTIWIKSSFCPDTKTLSWERWAEMLLHPRPAGQIITSQFFPLTIFVGGGGGEISIGWAATPQVQILVTALLRVYSAWEMNRVISLLRSFLLVVQRRSSSMKWSDYTAAHLRSERSLVVCCVCEPRFLQTYSP